MTITMAECSANFEIVENKKAKSTVWQHFGFVKEKDEVSKNRIACRHCKLILKYSENTSNLNYHMTRKHPSISTKQASSTASKSYEYTTKSTDIKTFFTKVPAHFQRTKDITNSILQFIVQDFQVSSLSC